MPHSDAVPQPGSTNDVQNVKETIDPQDAVKEFYKLFLKAYF